MDLQQRCIRNATDGNSNYVGAFLLEYAPTTGMPKIVDNRHSGRLSDELRAGARYHLEEVAVAY